MYLSLKFLLDIRTTTSSSTTAPTTEYYSPYTPQWRTPHTTQFWQYDNFISSTATSIPEPGVTTKVDLPDLTTRALPKADGVRRSAQTTTPATTSTRKTTTTTTKRPTTTTMPSTTTIMPPTTTEDPTTTEPSTPKEEPSTTKLSTTIEDSLSWRIYHPHENIHPWIIPDMENIFRTITKGIVPILTGLSSIVLMSLFIYLCIVPTILQCLTRPIGRNRR
ncbi:unnamed protein product [Caenorhabditis nigoni]